MQKIDMFSGINSLGIPYTKDNIEHIGYIDIIAKKLTEKGYDVNKINLSNIAKNRTFDLENIFMLNKKYKDIRNDQYFYLKEVREKNKYIGALIPKEYLDKYLFNDELDNVNVTDFFVNSDSPIFLYSGGENDFMTYIGTGPMELVNKDVRDKLPNNLEELVIKSVDCVENNWRYLTYLNNNVMIFAYSMFYAPLYDSIQEEIFKQNKKTDPNKKYVNKIKKLIDLFNDELLNRSLKYDNVEIINIEFLENYIADGDFHQNFIGNKLIAEKTIERVLKYERKNSKTRR